MKRKNWRILTIALLIFSLVLAGCAPAASGDDSSTEAGTVAPQDNAGVVGEGGGAGTGDKVTGDELAAATSSKDTLTMRMDADPATLNNVQTAIMNGIQILSMTNCSLLRTQYDAQMNSLAIIDERYGIATDYKVADDYSSITWTIRNDAKWHDGTPVTVEDIIFSLQRYRDVSRYNFADYDKIEKIDDTTFVVPLVRPDPSAISGLGGMQLVPKKVVEEVGEEVFFTSTAFLGCGAYKITEWVAGDHMTLEAVEGYFGGDPKIKNVVIRFIPEASVAMMELETGGIDVIDAPNWVDVQNVLNGSYENVAKYFYVPDQLHTMVGYNLSSDSPFQDLRVRQALAYALDRDAIAYGAYEGVGEVAYTIFSSAGENMLKYDKETWPYKQDLEKAKALLAEAGYPDGFEMTILTNQDANRSLAAQIVASQLAEIGLKANIVNYDNATYASTMSSETDSWDIWLRNWTAGTCWHTMITNTIVVNCHPDENDETWQYYNGLAEKMGGEMNDEARYAIEDELQENFLMDALYVYNLISPIKNIVCVDNLINLERCTYNWNMLDAYFE